MPSRSRIAITGANGLVGRHLCRGAAKAGWQVAAVVRSARGARLAEEAGAGQATIAGLTAAELMPAFEGAQAVVHLAQIGAERGGASYSSVNVEGTEAVVTAARRAGVARIVFLSGLGVTRYGMSRRVTNPYFLSKLVAETTLYRSGLETVVFRPSYIMSVGGELLPALAREIASGEVEVIGQGQHRMQPIGIDDAVTAILIGAASSIHTPSAFDLVGPEPISYRQLVDRVAGLLRQRGARSAYRLLELPEAEADRRARAGGYRGMLPDELDCLLCDEIADPGPLTHLIGRSLTPLDTVIAAALPEA